MQKKRAASARRKAAEADSISKKATDTVAETNTMVLGVNPALTIDQTLMAQSQAQGALFANMVSEQKRLVEAGQAAAIQNAADIIGIPAAKIDPLKATKNR